MSKYNTYIGMRYVPLFIGSWDTTMQTEYEPLTVVEYQGNSYTSRTFVPKNIPITNEEYWVLTGNYNAQIENYRAEVEAYANGMNALQTSMTQMSDEFNLYLNRLRGKKILVIGASNEQLDATAWGPCWTVYFKQMVESIGATCDVSAIGGMGIDWGADQLIEKGADYDIIIQRCGSNSWNRDMPIGTNASQVDNTTIIGNLNRMDNFIHDHPQIEYYMTGITKRVTGASLTTHPYGWRLLNLILRNYSQRFGWNFISMMEIPPNQGYGKTNPQKPDGTHFVYPYTQIMAQQILRKVAAGHCMDGVEMGSNMTNFTDSSLLKEGSILPIPFIFSNLKIMENGYLLNLTLQVGSNGYNLPAAGIDIGHWNNKLDYLYPANVTFIPIYLRGSTANVSAVMFSEEGGWFIRMKPNSGQALQIPANSVIDISFFSPWKYVINPN